jgi:hypothetical protein
MTRSTIILNAVAFLLAATAATDALAGDYSRSAASSLQGNGRAETMRAISSPNISRCQRVCVKTDSHGNTAGPQCIEWRTVC